MTENIVPDLARVVLRMLSHTKAHKVVKVTSPNTICGHTIVGPKIRECKCEMHRWTDL